MSADRFDEINARWQPTLAGYRDGVSRDVAWLLDELDRAREWLAKCQAAEFSGMHQRMVAIHAQFDAERIVRELAEREPPSGGCDFCSATGEGLYFLSRGIYIPDPDGHESDCLWRLAREWVAARPRLG